MRKKIILNEAELNNIIREVIDNIQTPKWPSYFNPRINSDGTVTLFHGLNKKSMDYVLTFGQISPRTCSEGVYGLWFATQDEGDYPSGYPCLISLDIPINDIGSSYKNRFVIQNSTHLISEKSVSLDEYNCKIIKLCNYDLTDQEIVDNLKRMINEKPKEMSDWLLEVCEYDSIYYYLYDILENE